MKIDLTYRGSLSSCNYECNYCPFAKKWDDKNAREKDQSELKNFIQWLESRATTNSIRLLFTPWGEALVRKWYRKALITISNMQHIQKVAIQTNLSASLDWLKEANNKTLVLWTTYHPSQTTIEEFVAQSNKLCKLGISHSVGIVGKKEYIEESKKLRAALSSDIYVWVNAYKDIKNYYQPEHVQLFESIDPHFLTNLHNHKSLGEPCFSGESAFSIRGDGTVYSCHFIARPLGNIYNDELMGMASRTNCPNKECDCYVGYRHLKKLSLESVYSNNIIARIPS